MACSRLFVRIFVVLFFVSACQSPAPQVNPIPNDDAQKIDHLLMLMNQRLGIAVQVAKAKWNSGSAIDDARRESRILDDVTSRAELINGCNRTLVRAFFQDQFDAGKMIQTNLFLSWRSKYPPGYLFDDAPNLASDVRPQLDKLSQELTIVLCDVQPIFLRPDTRHYLVLRADKVVRGDVNGAVRRRALRVLSK